MKQLLKLAVTSKKHLLLLVATFFSLIFLSIASQKNFIAIYHMGIYADPTLLNWFTQEYPKHSKGKLDMGKSCIRFKKADQIPFELIAELVTKMTPKQWIELYEKNYVKPKTK